MPGIEREIRSLGVPAEIRAENGVVRVEGYAAVFDQITAIGDWFQETIARGAFTEALGRDDVVFLINHEGLPLARTRSGTLTLTEDDHGLKMSAELDSSDPDVQRIVPKMQRGDLDKMSFAFWPEIQEWDETKTPPLRTVRKAALYDVSIVTTPAYDGTEIGLRGLEAARKAKRTENFNAAALRRRLKMNLALMSVRENG